jgi:hypothetical protein
MLFSGELSMTTSALGLLVPVDGEAGADPVADDVALLPVVGGALDVLLLEQAARPAARRPTAPAASALLLGSPIIVTVDLSFQGDCATEKGS